MASDLLSLADASILLGISSERVRQLVVAGDLPGVKFGNAWAVSRESVFARRHISNRRGRPLGMRRAWELIACGDVDLSNLSRYRNRGEVHRYAMSAGDLAFLYGQKHAMVSGAGAAASLGEPLQANGAEANLYISGSLHAEVGLLVAAVPDQLGTVIVRVVSDDVWPILENLELGHDRGMQHLAPRAAVALDLMESGDPRHWVAANHLIEDRG